MSEMSNGELGRLIGALQGEVRTGFSALNEKVDELGDKVTAVEKVGERQDQRIVNLERETFRRRGDWTGNEVTPARAATAAGDDARALTRRDAQIVGATFGTIGAAAGLVLTVMKLMGKL